MLCKRRRRARIDVDDIGSEQNAFGVLRQQRQSTFPSHPIPIVSLGAIRICSLACTRRSGRYHFDGKRASQLGRCVWELAAGCCRLAITQPGAEAAMPEFDLKDKAAIA